MSNNHTQGGKALPPMQNNAPGHREGKKDCYPKANPVNMWGSYMKSMSHEIAQILHNNAKFHCHMKMCAIREFSYTVALELFVSKLLQSEDKFKTEMMRIAKSAPMPITIGSNLPNKNSIDAINPSGSINTLQDHKIQTN